MDSDAKSVRERKRAITFMYFVVCLFYFLKAYSTSHLVFQGAGGGEMCCPILQIPTLFQTKKCHFPHPFSDPEVVSKRNITSLHKTEIISSLQQKHFLKSIWNSHITCSFFLYPFSDQSDPKTLSFGTVHSYMAYIRE